MFFIFIIVAVGLFSLHSLSSFWVLGLQQSQMCNLMLWALSYLSLQLLQHVLLKLYPWWSYLNWKSTCTPPFVKNRWDMLNWKEFNLLSLGIDALVCLSLLAMVLHGQHTSIIFALFKNLTNSFQMTNTIQKKFKVSSTQLLYQSCPYQAGTLLITGPFLDGLLTDQNVFAFKYTSQVVVRIKKFLRLTPFFFPSLSLKLFSFSLSLSLSLSLSITGIHHPILPDICLCKF